MYSECLKMLSSVSVKSGMKELFEILFHNSSLFYTMSLCIFTLFLFINVNPSIPKVNPRWVHFLWCYFLQFCSIFSFYFTNVLSVVVMSGCHLQHITSSQVSQLLQGIIFWHRQLAQMGSQQPI